MDSSNLLKNIIDVFNKLTMQQRLLIGGVLVVAFILFLFMMFAFNEPEYAVLYTELEQEDAAQIVSELNNQKVAYKLENDGATVLVPQDALYDLRLSLAAKSLPGSGMIGYEVFDQQQMGMSEFMQKLNYKRAIEGELSKTIVQQDGIHKAKVLIVIPPKSVFKEDQKEPTASVVLNLEKDFEISDKNVNAIANLVASGVEGLVPDKVTIVDTRGRLLSKEKEDELAEFTAKQYELKHNVESYLEGKAQGVMNDILGYGNSVIKVSVQLDFDQVEKRNTIFDPESQIEVSEQTVREGIAGRTYSDTTNTTRENSTTNYEVSNSIENIVEEAGNIKRITVAAVVNEITKSVRNGEEVELVTEPRSPELLQKIEVLISNAVGIDEQRLDRISVVSMPFDTQIYDEIIEETPPKPFMDEWGNTILMVLAIIAALVVLKNLLSKLKEERMLLGEGQEEESEGVSELDAFTPFTLDEELGLEPSAEGQELIDVGDIKKEISDDALRRQVRQEKIGNYVSKNPIEAAKLISIWLKEDEMS